MALSCRPRERLLHDGVTVLSDSELLAIILQKGSKNDNVIDVSNKLISRYGLNKLSRLSLTELQEIDGIGPAKAMQILAIFELNKRVKTQNNGFVIKEAKDVYNYMYPKVCNDEDSIIFHSFFCQEWFLKLDFLHMLF